MEESIIYGKIPSLNALKETNRVKQVFLNEDNVFNDAFIIAKEKNIKVSLVNKNKLNELSHQSNHQGIVCIIDEYKYTSLDNILKMTKGKDDALIVILDQINDPVNFGSIIRSSVAFGIDAIIIGKHRQVQITPTVSKIATGAESIIPIVQVTNINQTIAKLKEDNYWIVSSAGEAKTSYDQIDYKRKIALVIGNEGDGVSFQVKRNSDYVASIPLKGKVSALNASIATAVFLAQIQSSRNK